MSLAVYLTDELVPQGTRHVDVGPFYTLIQSRYDYWE